MGNEAGRDNSHLAMLALAALVSKEYRELVAEHKTLVQERKRLVAEVTATTASLRAMRPSDGD